MKTKSTKVKKTASVAEEKKVEKVTPFTWLDAITQKNADPMDRWGEKEYPAFMVNRGLSYYQDCVMYAAEINLLSGTLDNRMMYDYYMNAIKPRRRFSRWAKKRPTEDLKLVMQYYKVSAQKAEEFLTILTGEQLDHIREISTNGIE